jgi:hypothetical protein
MAETIASYSVKVDAAFDEIGATVDTLVTAFAGVTGDVAFLKDTIVQLQANPGPISPEDQALLDAGVPRAAVAVEKLRVITAAVKALDDATAGPIVEPPPVPPTP